MTVFLLFILYFSTIIQVGEYDKVKMYPALKDCEGISSQFKTIESFKDFAEHDKEGTLNNHGHGFYQCYCKIHSDFDVDEKNMCYHYRSNSNRYLIITNIISALVIAIT